MDFLSNLRISKIHRKLEGVEFQYLQASTYCAANLLVKSIVGGLLMTFLTGFHCILVSLVDFEAMSKPREIIRANFSNWHLKTLQQLDRQKMHISSNIV